MPDAAPDIEDLAATAPAPRNRAGLSFGSLSRLLLGGADRRTGGPNRCKRQYFLATVAVGRWAGSWQLGLYTVGMTAMISVVVGRQALVALPLS